MIKLKTKNGHIRIKVNGILANLVTNILQVTISSPISPGDTVYYVMALNGYGFADAAKVSDIGTKGFYVKFRGFFPTDQENELDSAFFPEFTPWSDLGKKVFLSREEAEAALVKKEEV